MKNRVATSGGKRARPIKAASPAPAKVNGSTMDLSAFITQGNRTRAMLPTPATTPKCKTQDEASGIWMAR